MRAELRPRERLWALAGLALALSALCLMLVDVRAALGGWLVAAAAFSAISAGATYLLLAMRLVPGSWGEEFRPTAEATSLLTPFAALAFVPVLLGVGALYPWAGEAGLHGFKAAWLGGIAFAVRTLVRFGALVWVSHRVRRRQRTVATAAGGLVVLPILASFSAVDWLMSLDPDFASSAFGLLFLIREALIGFSVTLLLRLRVGRPPQRLWVAGALLLTLLLVWAYLQYMAFLTSWSGNLPASAHWYIERGERGWGLVAALWGGLGLAAVLCLLFPTPRSRPRWLIVLAALVFASQLLELVWTVLPLFPPLAILAAALALGGLGALAVAALPLALRYRIRSREPQP